MSGRVPVGALAWIGVLAFNRERGRRPGFNSRVRPRPRCEHSKAKQSVAKHSKAMQKA